MPDFRAVTERPGLGATAEQCSMLYTRYRLAADHGAGRGLLEVACGTGMGLAYLSGAARRAVGGDLDSGNLAEAASRLRGRAAVARFDAHELPFRDATFDVVLLFEAIYYLRDAARFAEEARRVTKAGGTLLVCSVNPDIPGFHRSPHSTRYWSAADLESLLRRAGFSVEMLGGFPSEARTMRGRIVTLIQRLAGSLRLIPDSLRGRELLKRIFLGRLEPLGPEVRDGMAPLEPLGPAERGLPKVLYAVGRKSLD